jgi:RNA ligase (TIGR02306 family)
VKKHGLLDAALAQFGPIADAAGEPALLFGEVFGQGIQDLGYGVSLDFRAFDMCVGVREKALFMPFDAFDYHCMAARIDRVPVLYRGPFNREKLAELTDGKTTFGGAHIREGVVVKSATEDRHPRYGRKIAKSVSEAYLLRKNATEFA